MGQMQLLLTLSLDNKFEYMLKCKSQFCPKTIIVQASYSNNQINNTFKKKLIIIE